MKKDTTDEYDRMVEHRKSACATCVYGFPAPIGYSCGITRKPSFDVIIRCGAYKRRSGAKGAAPAAQSREEA